MRIAGTFNLMAGIAVIAALFAATAANCADEAKPQIQQVKLRVLGMFSPERQDDLKQAGKELTEVTLESIDYENCEATFSYDASKRFKNKKPDQIEKDIDGMVKQATNHTFGVKALCAVPKDKLTRVEIPVSGLDCKGCCLGAYWGIYNIEGVEQATVSFKEGRVVAMIDESKTNRAALIDALRKKSVKVNEPEAPPPAKQQ
jgi:hypothetical protein